MKKEELKELFRKKSVKAGSLALAAMIAVGSLWTTQQQSTVVPELVTFVDMEGSTAIEEDEVPLASTKVTKSTKTTKKTKKIKMKKASKKTYTKAGKTTKKTTTKKSSNSKSTTTTKTEKTTSVTNKYKKGSKVNTQVTTVKTTVTKTVVSKEASSKKTTNKAATSTATTNKTTAQAAAQTSTAANGTVAVKTAAPKVDSRVTSAFETLHFTVKVDSSVAYSGLFDARTQSITMKKIDDTIYHELGHFVAFIAGNMDKSSDFIAVYNSEKANYTASNKAYVLSTSSEYFAESFKNYTLDPAALKAERPQTYAAMEEALSRITGAQVSAIWNIYKSIWK